MPVYQNKKNGTWKYRVYAEDIYGQRKQFEKSGFATKREAQFAERERALTQCSGESEITFSQLWEEYKEYIELRLKTQSLRKTKSKFENHILPYFANYKVKNITASIYIKWQKEILNKGYKHKYNSSIHTAMVTILNYAMKFHGLKTNIASLIGNFTRKDDLETNVDFWTLEEFNKFISVIPKEDNIYKIFYITLYFTGLRQGECLALTWNDFHDNYFDIYKTISKEKKDGEYVINTPKTKKSNRKIKLSTHLIQELNELREYFTQFEGFDDSWFIFGGIDPITPSTIGRRKDKYCELANIKKIRIHDLRHSHASLLLSYGLPITVISQRLGHSDTNMTLNTYSHLLPQDEDKAIDILNNISLKNI